MRGKGTGENMSLMKEMARRLAGVERMESGAADDKRTNEKEKKYMYKTLSRVAINTLEKNREKIKTST